MKLKSRLLPFSLIRIRCRRVFLFLFRSLLPLSKFWWYLHADKVGMLGGSKFHIWDRVLRRLTGKYHWSVQQNVWPVSGLSHMGTNLLPDPYGFVRIRFQINRFLFFEILFTDRALPTIRRMDKILGKVSPSPYSPKITVAYGELRVYFAVQIPPFIDWLERLRWHWVCK